MTAPAHEEYRVFGPPGTGKTTFLQNQVEKWARAEGSDGIMVASFTRAAAAELSSRDLPLHPRQVGTLHSYAYRAMGGSIEIAEKHVADFNQTHPGFALSVEQQTDVEDHNIEVISGRTDGDRLMSEWSVLRAQRVPVELWSTSIQSFAYAWGDWKDGNDLLDFTDLIEIALTDTLVAPGEPTIGFFDEVQDFTPLELALVRRWAAGMDRVVLAGDDDQCIYAFTGATPDAFLDPPVDDEHKRVLSQSYRLPGAVHAIASRWITQVERRETKDYAPRVDAVGRVRFLETATARAPDLLVREIDDHLAVPDRTVMVLTSCSFMLDQIKAALKAAAIPFHNPYRRKRGDWNPLVAGTEKRRTAVDRLLAFLRPQPDVWGELSRWYTGDDVKAWVDPLTVKDLLARGAKSNLPALPGNELDVDLFDALFLPAAIEEVMFAVQRGDVAWFDRHLMASKARPFEFPVHVARTRGGAVLRERPRVVIGTIHSVKGAQADVVYLAPDLSAPAMQEYIGGDRRAHDAVVRQFYVGMTRAREELVVLNRMSPLSIDPEGLTHGELRR